jgi:hypothetical protein
VAAATSNPQLQRSANRLFSRAAAKISSVVLQLYPLLRRQLEFPFDRLHSASSGRYAVSRVGCGVAQASLSDTPKKRIDAVRFQP